MYIKSIPRSRAAIAQAGTWMGMGIIVSLAAGFAKITEKIKPLKIESLPQ